MNHLIIPARYGSTRFPGKPLARICGVPMVVRTYQAVQKAQDFDQIFVLTDNVDIHMACLTYAVPVVLQEVEAANGTERIAKWAVDRFADDDIVVNVQGDEPMMDVGIVNRLRFNVEQRPGFVWTVARWVKIGESNNRDVVKCFRNFEGGLSIESWSRDAKSCFDHVQLGIYAYTVKRLREYLEKPPTAEEQSEGLEQLRWGEPLACFTTEYDGIGVDRPDDIQKVEERLMKT